MTFSVKELIANQQRAISMLRMSDNRYLGAREDELAEISDFLDECCAEKHGGSMFVFGMSGTGKTTTVEHAVAACRSRHRGVATVAMSGSSFGSFRDFAMELVNNLMGDNHIRFSKVLTGRKLDYRRLCILMTSLFQQSKFTICLIDEVDYLQSFVKFSRGAATKANWMLQALFMAANAKHSNVVLIAISNHIELATRIAAKQCRKILFRPYTSDQICKVISSKLSQLGDEVTNAIMSKTSLLVLARRVANTAGDLRACLDAFARAIAESGVALEKRLTSIESISTQASLEDFNASSSGSDSSLCLVDVSQSDTLKLATNALVDEQEPAVLDVSTLGATVTPSRLPNNHRYPRDYQTPCSYATRASEDDIDLLHYRVDHRDITRATPTLSLDRRELLKVHLQAMPTLELLVLLAVCRACICFKSHSVALGALKMPLLALAETLGMDVNSVNDFYCEKLQDAIDVFCQVGLLHRGRFSSFQFNGIHAGDSAYFYHQVDDGDYDFDGLHFGRGDEFKNSHPCGRGVNGKNKRLRTAPATDSDETPSQVPTLSNKCATAGIIFRGDPREIAALVLETVPVLGDLSLKDDIEAPWHCRNSLLATMSGPISKDRFSRKLSWIRRKR